MKKLFEYADKYVKQSTWKNFALVKLCLCAAGIMIGTAVPESCEKNVFAAALCVFVITYVPLMAGFIKVIKERKNEYETEL